MHDDDEPVGRVLSRRRALALFGASAVAALAPATRLVSPDVVLAAAADCVALPEQTEGPYFVDRTLERADIRRDPATGRMAQGAPLTLRFQLSQIGAAAACVALPNAQVEVWHCNATGVYSGVQDRNSSTVGEMFLRGHQVADDKGEVRFTTIYPGWYPGRAVHIHFKVRAAAAGGGTDEFTSQLYFDDTLTDVVHAREPYSGHRGQRLLNARDTTFRQGGSQLVLPVAEERGNYAATFRIAMHPGQSRRTTPRRRARRG